MTVHAHHSCRPWTDAEDARLRKMREAGADYGVCAIKLVRGYDSVRRRASRIGCVRPRGADWTPERDAELRKLWADGLSASQIAGRLGSVTRNAVLGKVHRLGLAGRATISRMTYKQRAKPTTPKKPRREDNPQGWNGTITPPAPTWTPSIPPSLPTVPTVSFVDLEHRHCRYIGDRPDLINLDTPVFCGQPKADGSSYCAAHHARCTQPPYGRLARAVHYPTRRP